MRERVLVALAALVIGLGAGGCSKARKPPPPPDRDGWPPASEVGGRSTSRSTPKTTPQAPPDPSARTDWTQPPHVEVLYKGTSQYGWGISFAGVRPDLSQVVVVEETGSCLGGTCGPVGFDVETIDYAKHERVDRWHAKKDLGCVGTMGLPLGDVADDLRWSKLVAALGVPKERSTEIPRFWPSPDGKGVLYIACTNESGDNYVMAAGANGELPRAIGRVHQGHTDVFPSPNGRLVAWTYSGGIPRGPHGEGPTGAPRVPGELHVASVEQQGDDARVAPPDRVLKFPDASIGRPLWSRDGSRIYVTTRAEGPPYCLVWTDPAKLDAPQQLRCADALPTLVEASTGSSGIVYSGSQIQWIELPSGKEKATRTIPAAQSRFVLLDPSGTMIATEGKGSEIVVMDLATGRSAEVTPPYGYYFGLDKTRWIDARRFVLLSSGNKRHYQIIAIDAAALLGR